MGKKKHLIIGCGAAGLSALEKIRSLTSEDEVKLVSSENYPPYSPTVLPYLLSGRIKEEDIGVRDREYFTEMKSSLAEGIEVVQVIPEKKEVVYRDGSKDEYDSLLIASGSEPVRLSITGLDEIGFLGFHTLTDCRNVMHRLTDTEDVAIYGGGLVAAELAAALLEKGHRVSVIVRSWLLRSYFDRETAALIEDILRSEGAQFFNGTEVSEVKKNKDRIEIAFSSGERLPASFLITCVGVRPRLAFLEGTGIRLNKGVLVDRSMRTNIRDIYAAGDVAEAPDFFTGQPVMNPILPEAVIQGKVAGANMFGENEQYEGTVSTNVFNFFGNTAFSVGGPTSQNETEEVLKHSDEKRNQYKKLFFKDGKLVKAMFLNVDVLPGVILYLIKNRVNVAPYKTMLLEKTFETSSWLMLQAENQKRFMGQ